MNKKKKILAVFGNVAYFGQERSNINVFRLLINNGYDLKVLVNDRGFHWHLQPVFEQLGIPYVKIRYSWGLHKPFTIKKILIFLAEIWMTNIHFLRNYWKYKPDYIHIANDFFYFSLIPSFCFINKTKIIFRLGDEPVVWWFPLRLAWRYFISKQVDTFVCNSHYIHTKLSAAGRKRHSNDIVLYSIPSLRIDIVKEEESVWNHIERCKQSGRIIVTYLGRISENKGCGDIIIAAKEIKSEHEKDFTFLIAGNIEHTDEYSMRYVSEVKEFDENYIITVGEIKNVPKLFMLSDIHVAPSLVEEAQGLVVVEAKREKRASIIYPSGGMKELITHQVDGYICPQKSPKAIEEALLYYLEHKEEIKQQGEAAYNSLNRLNINEEYFSSKWLNVYGS
jgi:glycosyltransferase involved in cell wall biosynthesis